MLLDSPLRMTLLCVCNSFHYLFNLHDPCSLTPTAPADYSTVNKSLTFTSIATEGNVTVPIVNDIIVNTTERFFANLELVSSNVEVVIKPTQASVNIRSEDGT